MQQEYQTLQFSIPYLLFQDKDHHLNFKDNPDTLSLIKDKFGFSHFSCQRCQAALIGQTFIFAHSISCVRCFSKFQDFGGGFLILSIDQEIINHFYWPTHEQDDIVKQLLSFEFPKMRRFRGRSKNEHNYDRPIKHEEYLYEAFCSILKQTTIDYMVAYQHRQLLPQISDYVAYLKKCEDLETSMFLANVMSISKRFAKKKKPTQFIEPYQLIPDQEPINVSYIEESLRKVKNLLFQTDQLLQSTAIKSTSSKDMGLNHEDIRQRMIGEGEERQDRKAKKSGKNK